MDVIFHLTEDAVYRKYLEQLFVQSSSKYIIIYSADENHKEFLKRYGVSPGIIGKHVRLRKFTDDVSQMFPEWTLKEKIDNEYPYKKYDPKTSFCDFYIYESITGGNSVC